MGLQPKGWKDTLLVNYTPVDFLSINPWSLRFTGPGSQQKTNSSYRRHNKNPIETPKATVVPGFFGHLMLSYVVAGREVIILAEVIGQLFEII
jgi:hypothetical protein